MFPSTLLVLHLSFAIMETLDCSPVQACPVEARGTCARSKDGVFETGFDDSIHLMQYKAKVEQKRHKMSQNVKADLTSQVPFVSDDKQLKCKPTASVGDLMVQRNAPTGTMTCTPLELTFDDGTDKVESYRSQFKYCYGGYTGVTGGDWLNGYHEAIVAWTVLHPLRARANESIFLDIGANSGIFSVMAANEGFKVYSFEPQPVCADNILYMKQINPSLRFKVFNMGVGCQSEKMMVFGDECGMNWQNDPNVGAAFSRNYEVPQVPLSSFNIWHGAAAPFFKVDTDGGELEIAKAVLDLIGNDKFSVLPEMYFEINPGHIPKVSGCQPCDPCLGSTQVEGPNGCWGNVLNEAEQVFNDLGKLYKNIYLFAMANGPCESREGVKQHLQLYKTVSASRQQWIYRVLDFPEILKICIHQNIEDLPQGQMNVWFAS